jgi:hypothetical protein
LGDTYVLDFAVEETALETKRRELASMVTEGRQVVAALSERQTAIGRKIQEALDGVQRLQDQINAIDIVMGLVDQRTVSFQAPRPAPPVLEVVPSHVTTLHEAEDARPLPFRPVAFLRCVAEGHDFRNSRSNPGHITCRRCRHRRGGG